MEPVNLETLVNSDVNVRSAGRFRLDCVVRPGLGKLSFPVGRVGKKRPVGRSEFFFFPNFIFHKLECTGEKGNFFLI